jgi:hypothetical protein
MAADNAAVVAAVAVARRSVLHRTPRRVATDAMRSGGGGGGEEEYPPPSQSVVVVVVA